GRATDRANARAASRQTCSASAETNNRTGMDGVLSGVRAARGRSRPQLPVLVNDDRDVSEFVVLGGPTDTVEEAIPAEQPVLGLFGRSSLGVAAHDHLCPVPLGLCRGAGVGSEADRRPVGAVRALVSVEVEDGYADDRDALRVAELASGTGDRVVLALDGDRVAVAHVFETEGRGVVEFDVLGQPATLHTVVGDHLVCVAAVRAYDDPGLVAVLASHAVALLELAHSVILFSLIH